MFSFKFVFYCCFTLDAVLLSVWLRQLFLSRYEPFDFHKECKAMKWYRLSLLMDRIAAEQQQFGFVTHRHIIGRCLCLLLLLARLVHLFRLLFSEL